jgi:hypothetical protein
MKRDLDLSERGSGSNASGRLAAYLNGGLGQVAGWLSEDIAHITRLLSVWQHARRITGDVVEIGVHHGRYFIVLALLCDAGERAIAVDVFEAQHLNLDGSGRGDLAVFLDQCARHIGTDTPPLVHAVDSLSLRGRDLTQAGLPTGTRRSVRLFSVDGCHTAQHTLNDLYVATESLVPGGVVLLDDFFAPGWPGVQEGVHRFLLANPGWCVAAYHPSKAFITRREDAAALQNFFEHDIADLVTHCKVVELHGARALELGFDGLHLAFDPALRRAPVLRGSFGTQSGQLVQLVSGWWREREAEGTWMTEAEAEAVLRIPSDAMPPGTVSAVLALEVMPFVHLGRPTRPLTISTSFGPPRTLELSSPLVVEFALDGAALGRPLCFRFLTSEPERPGDVMPGYADMRPLGCMMRRLTLSFSTDRPATTC